MNKKDNPTISVAMLKKLINAYGKLGGESNYKKIISRYDLNPFVLNDDKNRVPIHVLYEMCELGADRLDDPVLGLNIVQHIDVNSLKWFEQLFFMARNVKDALEIFSRYHHVYLEVVTMEVQQLADSSRWELRSIEESKITYHYMDATMVAMHRFINYFDSDGILSIDFAHPCPKGCESLYQDYFKVPVLFNQPTTCFNLRNDWLETEVNQFSDPTYRDLAYSERLLTQAKGECELEEQVRFLLRKMLFTGDVSTSSIAEAMNIPLRTFQRRLKAKDIRFRELLEDTRKSLSMEYLKSGKYTFCEIAFLVGYGDAPSFSRAFKIWTGMAPTEYSSLYTVNQQANNQ